MLWRDRFKNLVERQLSLFAQEHERELTELTEARRAYRQASRDDAEEAFGDLQDLVDWTAEELAAMRDAYAAGLEPEQAAAYARSFERGVRRRFPALADAVAEPEA